MSQPEAAVPAGPVFGTAEIDVDAPVETVWRVLTELEQWPSWNPDVTSMTVDGPLARGTVFRWKAGPRTIVSTIERVEPPRTVVWSGKTLGVKATHAWHFEQVGEKTHVLTEEALRGSRRAPPPRLVAEDARRGARERSAQPQGGGGAARGYP